MSIYIDFIKHLKNKISESADSVYLEDASPGASFPYVVYSLPTKISREIRKDFILEVNIWDNCEKNDTTVLENFVNDIDNTLNEHKYNNDNLQISIYRISRSMIPDPDENIRRRELRYECKTYFYST